ncbi:MAG: hypothetical protein K2G41_01790 [Duncaniella sp.]|uniref:hypothetical protein n=1 Tax=Duncaniella sp. TaxID=2518496 RepID=UPI0023CD7916|nr:hypothetical protein [Duncaniella sp.]MDE6089410.1 hypothetical protein [Duncaniella sp.]
MVDKYVHSNPVVGPALALAEIQALTIISNYRTELGQRERRPYKLLNFDTGKCHTAEF